MSKTKEVNINDTKFNMKDVLKFDEEPKDKNDKNDNVEPEPKPEEPGPSINYKEEQNVEEKRKRLLVINRYKNSSRFGEWLTKQGFNFDSKTLEAMSNEELETMINDIRFCIATKNTNGMYGRLSTQGVVILENILRPVYKIDGLSKILESEPTYLDTVEELALEYQNYLYVQPQYRLMYCVLSSAYIVHSQHTMLEKLSKTEDGQQLIKQMAEQINNTNHEFIKPVNPEFNDRFGDLMK